MSEFLLPRRAKIVKYPEPMTRQQRAKLRAALDREEGLPAVKTQRPGKYKAPESMMKWKCLPMRKMRIERKVQSLYL